ncbi:MAG TPA: hypothetical protein VMR98_05815, partial [Candidatus Polarisedimenticolaceae bacterium]|nr:hypothetical protein [Candidatus Polarisedimenticolaceae bacterium]
MSAIKFDKLGKASRTLLAAVLVLSGVFLIGPTSVKAAACTTTLSVGDNVRTAVANAPAGGVVCLNNGDYGYVSLDNIDKPNYVTLKSTTGQGATIGFPQDTSNNLGLTGVADSSYLNFESLIIRGMTIISSENIRLSQNSFIGPYNFQIRANTTDLNNIFVDNNHFDNFTEEGYEARFHIPGPENNLSTDPGRNIKVTNNVFHGGCNDGMQVGG